MVGHSLHHVWRIAASALDAGEMAPGRSAISARSGTNASVSARKTSSSSQAASSAARSGASASTEGRPADRRAAARRARRRRRVRPRRRPPASAPRSPARAQRCARPSGTRPSSAAGTRRRRTGHERAEDVLGGDGAQGRVREIDLHVGPRLESSERAPSPEPKEKSRSGEDAPPTGLAAGDASISRAPLAGRSAHSSRSRCRARCRDARCVLPAGSRRRDRPPSWGRRMRAPAAATRSSSARRRGRGRRSSAARAAQRSSSSIDRSRARRAFLDLARLLVGVDVEEALPARRSVRSPQPVAGHARTERGATPTAPPAARRVSICSR